MFKALVISGDGINCEQETADALKSAGFSVYIIHINDLLERGYKLFETLDLLVIPGGFSFGDELGSGKLLSLKLKYGMGRQLQDFIDRGGAVLGICNGFQVLTQLGIFGKSVVLSENSHGRFLNRWIDLEIIGKSIFTDPLIAQGKVKLELPIRHGEGRLIVLNPEDEIKLVSQSRCVMKYGSDINGSWNQIAALSSSNGLVLGLMPHPEAFWSNEMHPTLNRNRLPIGLELFNNAYQYFKQHKSRGL